MKKGTLKVTRQRRLTEITGVKNAQKCRKSNRLKLAHIQSPNSYEIEQVGASPCEKFKEKRRNVSESKDATNSVLHSI